ncbi:MAG: hypothetical protein Q9176_007734, partial [Flavoplaca citrina]
TALFAAEPMTCYNAISRLLFDNAIQQHDKANGTIQVVSNEASELYQPSRILCRNLNVNTTAQHPSWRCLDLNIPDASFQLQSYNVSCCQCDEPERQCPTPLDSTSGCILFAQYAFSAQYLAEQAEQEPKSPPLVLRVLRVLEVNWLLRLVRNIGNAIAGVVAEDPIVGDNTAIPQSVMVPLTSTIFVIGICVILLLVLTVVHVGFFTIPAFFGKQLMRLLKALYDKITLNFATALRGLWTWSFDKLRFLWGRLRNALVAILGYLHDSLAQPRNPSASATSQIQPPGLQIPAAIPAPVATQPMTGHQRPGRGRPGRPSRRGGRRRGGLTSDDDGHETA